MSTAGTTFKQKATHKLNRGETGQNSNSLLAHRIQPFERIVSVREATNEEFAEFIWWALQQLYTDEKKMMDAFDEHFDVDWTSRVDRAGALVNLVEINKSREKQRRIRLFVKG